MKPNSNNFEDKAEIYFYNKDSKKLNLPYLSVSERYLQTKVRNVLILKGS